MRLEPALRRNAKIKMAIQGPSGSGKTYSALLVAYGLCGDWYKVGVIDTENKSSELYDHLGTFHACHFEPPFTPERYIEAIQLCESHGIEVIIVDSISHEWDGLGGILEIHAAMSGNSFTNWGKVSPRHTAFIQAMLQSTTHVIATVRSKQDYILTEKNGKQVPEKVGLKGIQRDGLEYDFTLVFDLDMRNVASTSKDRTGLFYGKPEARLSANTGHLIKKWCNSGKDVTTQDISQRIGDCRTIQELLQLYKAYPQFNGVLQPEYEKHKLYLMNNSTQIQLPSPQNLSTNGTH